MEYKPTLFDRHGPAAVDILKAWGHGLTTFSLALVMFGVLAVEMLHYRGWAMVGFTVGLSAVSGFIAGRIGLMGGRLAGDVVHEVLLSGAGAPYQEQFSYEQSLVMKGAVTEALASFEKRIGEPNAGVDVRLRAAELYAKEGANPLRAAELFREARSQPRCTAGQDTYATNRLVDLLTGPLNDTGRALGELRRLIDRYPAAPSATHARAALAALKQGMLDPSS